MAEVKVTHAELYRASDGWRFRIKAANGEPIASGEAYVDRRDAVAAIAALNPDLEVVEVAAG